MGRRHDRDELLARAVEAALDGGIGELTFGKLGRRLGVADRTLVYYFVDKPTLIEAVLGVLAGRLLERLDAAFGPQRRPADELLQTAAPLLMGPAADPIFALWFELAGQAAVGHEPQRTLAHLMIAGWLDWLAERIEAEPDRRPLEAATLLARLDGALLLHHLGHPEAARRAVTGSSEL